MYTTKKKATHKFKIASEKIRKTSSKYFLKN